MEEKLGERKAEKIGSEAKESSGDEAAPEAELAGVEEEVGVLKVERRCRGDDEEVGDDDDESGDLWSGTAGDAIVSGSLGWPSGFGFLIDTEILHSSFNSLLV